MFTLPDSGKRENNGRESERMRRVSRPFPGFGTKNVRYSSGLGRKRKNDFNRSRLPLFRQGGATVSLTARLSAERDQGSSIFIGRFVEAIREMLIRRDVLGIL